MAFPMRRYSSCKNIHKSNGNVLTEWSQVSTGNKVKDSWPYPNERLSFISIKFPNIAYYLNYYDLQTIAYPFLFLLCIIQTSMAQQTFAEKLGYPKAPKCSFSTWMMPACPGIPTRAL